MIRETIKKVVSEALDNLGLSATDFAVEKPKTSFGDYAVNAAFNLAKKMGKPAEEIAQELAEKINQGLPKEIAEAKAVDGYLNFFLSQTYLQQQLSDIASQKDYGLGNSLENKTVMVEYTAANPFKLFHIGHLMSNTIGEAIARLYEAAGAKVIRANYQGDVGLHVAMSVWAMKNVLTEPLAESATLTEKVKYLGQAYAAGAKAYQEQNTSAKTAIEATNEKIYTQSDPEINRLYAAGRKWSLEYFEEVYQKLGTKFDRYFFESEAGKDGLDIVMKNKNIFTESDGAIVFRGEKYGLHTRVLVNSRGLPTYEAKELGLNQKKFALYSLDLSIIVTGNEIAEYFKVLLKAMELTMPAVAQKTRHIAHGMLRLASGKMSSRTGEVITAKALIDQARTRIKEKENPAGGLPEAERESTTEQIAIGAIKYSILKQSPGRDIVFDFSKSLSVQGDSGPYLQYAYSRLASILAKAGKIGKGDVKEITSDHGSNVIKHLIEFPEAISQSQANNSPNTLALYLYELAGLANRFYETAPILKDENEKRKNAHLLLIKTAAAVLKSGLEILGIKTPSRI